MIKKSRFRREIGLLPRNRGQTTGHIDESMIAQDGQRYETHSLKVATGWLCISGGTSISKR